MIKVTPGEMTFGATTAVSLVGLGLAVACASGCSDPSNNAPGGTGDSGPSADGAMARDGGGPVPPAAQGAVSLHLEDPIDSSSRCAAGRQWVNAPHGMGTIQMQQTSAAEAGPKAVNGAEGNAVTCKVERNGPRFGFSGEITAAAADRNGTPITPTVVQLGIPEGIGVNESSVSGYVRVQTHTTNTTYSSTSCVFSVQPLAPGEALGVDIGRIWGAVTCESLVDPLTAGVACGLTAGYFIFENCT